MRASIRKWGNSTAIRLPAAIINSTHIKVDSEVEIKEKDGCIIIMPIAKKYNLDDLLKGITSKNCHDEKSTGKPVGKEFE